MAKWNVLYRVVEDDGLKSEKRTIDVYGANKFDAMYSATMYLKLHERGKEFEIIELS